MSTPDRVIVRDLLCRGILGIHPEERTTPQAVVVSLTLECDTRPAAESEFIADAIDYSAVADKARALVETGRFQLVETLCDRLAAACLEDPRVAACEVSVEKPDALADAAGVGVTIRRERYAPGA
ncbi:dihydroneopterin aldolase [Alienimonas chondri]|uniref:7,8-dihydroneopterin aldolase n=1 Tax=Alienimonas chondri TaxID=2681879 RepID=A0ABX1VG46_9PLAN|nr:dihydroneopterin aldolase [Alienimonas chondri]NNJ27087.1 Dihydroneopterin aldolase [Alienimonas chondri]